MPAHEVKFERNRFNGSFRAGCTCGWFDFSDHLEILQGRAAVHDLEWEATAVETQESRV